MIFWSLELRYLVGFHNSSHKRQLNVRFILHALHIIILFIYLLFMHYLCRIIFRSMQDQLPRQYFNIFQRRS